MSALRGKREAGGFKKLPFGMFSALATRLISAAAPLILVPISVNYLGASLYGVWMSAGGMAAVLLVFDLGVSSTFLTLLPPSISMKDWLAVKRIISAGYFLVCAVSFVAACVVALLASTGLLSRMAGAPAVVDGVETDALIAIVLISFLATLPLQLINRVLYAEGETASSNVLQAMAAALAIPLAFLVVRLDGSPLLLVACVAFAGAAFLGIASVVHFTRSSKELRPSIRMIERRSLYQVLTMGSRYLSLTLLTALATNLDVVVISHFSSPAEAAAFAVPQRLFAQVTALVSVVVLPLWPAISAAVQRNEMEWVWKSVRQLSLGGMVGVLGIGMAAATLFFGAIQKWIGTGVQLDRSLLIGLALWCAVQAFYTPYLMLLNAMKRLRVQVYCLLSFITVGYPVKILAVWFASDWLIPYVNSVVYAVTFSAVAIVVARIQSES